MKMISCVMLLLLVILTGCNQASVKRENAAGEIKVLYYNEESFWGLYGKHLSTRYPNVSIEVIPVDSHQGDDDAIRQIIEERQPDVIIGNLAQYSHLAASGLLYELSPFFQSGRLRLEDMAPLTIDALNDYGGGQLYGLTPSFKVSLLFYNKDLFDRYQAAYPHNQMSWEQVLDIARRFAVDEHTYGLSYYDGLPFYYFAEAIGRTKGLLFEDPVSGRMTADTPAWREALNLALSFASSGTASFKQAGAPAGLSKDEQLKRHPFIAGHTAMMLQGPQFIRELTDAAVSLKGEVPNWGVVTAPVDPRNPDMSGDVQLNQIFSIYRHSAHVDLAWEIIQYIHSVEYAPFLFDGLPSNRSAAPKLENFDQDVLYMLKPSPVFLQGKPSLFPERDEERFRQMVMDEIEAVYNGAKTVEEGLQAIQLQGEEWLRQLPSPDRQE